MKKGVAIYVALVLSFMSICTSSLGQVYKLKSKSYSFRYKIDDYEWSKWSKWEDTAVLIAIDWDKERITIYSKEKQVYDIVEYKEKKYDDDGDVIFPFLCVDIQGKTCRVRLIKPSVEGQKIQLYVDYSDMMWVYNVYFLD